MDPVNGHYVPRTLQGAQGNSVENDGSIISIQMSRKVAGLQVRYSNICRGRS